MRPGLHPVWRDYRNRQRAVFAAFAGLPAVLLAALALGSTTGDPVSGRILASAWSTLCVAATVWFGSFRCPFCNGHFHWTWLVSNPFASRCLHCGFEKLRDPEAGRAYAQRR